MKDSLSLKRIKCLCSSKKLDSKEIYHSAKTLLSIYRDVIWQTMDQLDDMYDSISGIDSDFLSNDLDSAFDAFVNFASDVDLADFEGRIISLSKTKLIIDLIDKAMFRVYNYYNNGPLYHEILSKTYLVKYPYSESEILEMLDIERSYYYTKKKEALLLFGISLWGYEAKDFNNLIILKSNEQ